MKKEEIKKTGVLLEEGKAGNYWVRIYVREEGYTCKVYRSSSENKIIKEMAVDSFSFVGESFVFCMKESNFAYVPGKKDECFIGKVYDENFYVFTGPEGKEHYFCFVRDNGFAPVFGEAEKTERIVDDDGFIYLLMYETSDRLRVFFRDSYDSFWEEHSSGDWWHRFSYEEYYRIWYDEDCLYVYFYDDAAERFILLYGGKNLCNFDNVYVEENDGSYIVYIYDGKDLVAAEEGKSFLEDSKGIRLDEKLWFVKEGSHYVIDPQVHYASDEKEQSSEQCGEEDSLSEKQYDVFPDNTGDVELSGKRSWWSRLGLWFGWWQ